MHKAPTISDRLVAGFCYFTAGILGIVWLVILHIRKSKPSKFLQFNMMQSIFLSVCYVALNFVFNLIVRILEFIPFINRLVRQIVYLFNMPFACGYSIMQCLIYGVILYLFFTAVLGRYSYLPWVSKKVASLCN